MPSYLSLSVMRLDPLSQLSQQFERGRMCDASEPKYSNKYFLEKEKMQNGKLIDAHIVN